MLSTFARFEWRQHGAIYYFNIIVFRESDNDITKEFSEAEQMHRLNTL